MNKVVVHVVCYSLVAAGSFWGGAVTRDYLVTKAARENRARYGKFLNQPAPPLASRTVDASPWNLQEQKGKVVVIEVWATWCRPCIAALPTFQRLHERFGQRSDFQLVGVSLDKEAEVVKRVCAARGIGWTQLLEPGKEFESSIAQMLEVSGVPFTCVIDKEGVVRVYRDTSGDLERLVQRLLGEPIPSPESTSSLRSSATHL